MKFVMSESEGLNQINNGSDPEKASSPSHPNSPSALKPEPQTPHPDPLALKPTGRISNSDSGVLNSNATDSYKDP